MNILLDTNALIRAISDPGKLSSKALELIENADNRVLVSIACLWELQIKKSIGKISLPDELGNILINSGYEILNIKTTHIDKLTELPQIHRDPFDRMLIAQSICEGLVLMTSDAEIYKYESEEFRIFKI